jgi:hypothetical protein
MIVPPYNFVCMIVPPYNFVCMIVPLYIFLEGSMLLQKPERPKLEPRTF